MKTVGNLILSCVTFLLVVLAGCSRHDVADYRTLSPNFDFFSYFEGKSWGRGIVFNRSGRMTRMFIVEVTGTFASENRLVLDEKFRWNDGEQTRRVWSIDREQESITANYTGGAADVLGRAEGRSAGNSFNWSYTLALEVDGTIWDIAFDDWLFLQEGNVLFNRAIMRKFGLRVGEVFIVFSKEPSFGNGGTP